jgi:erythromycin esterase
MGAMPYWSASRRITAASRPPPPGEDRPSASASGQRWPAATRRCSLFHATQPTRFLLTWRAGDTVTEGMREPRLERAIGVIYRPETERMSHYFRARLPDQFDAVLHFDETRAVEPLGRTAEWETGEVPETFPFAV